MSEAVISENPSKHPGTQPVKKRMRSPSYPFVNLNRAIELAVKLWDAEKRHPATIPIVCGHWGLSMKSSAGVLSVAALKKFGLLVEDGSGANRTVRLSDAALEIIKNKDVPEELEPLVKKAAMKPEIHRELWENFRDASDASIIRHLVFDLKFNDNAVHSVVDEYRETIAFAKLTASDTVEDIDPEGGEGALALPSSTTSSPVIQAPSQVSQPRKEQSGPPLAHGLRYLPIPLDIGDAPIPVGMSEDDFGLLIATLNLWKKKIVKPEFPRNAIWRNGDSDKPVVIAGFMGAQDGRGFFRSEDGSGIPADELEFLQ